MDPIAQILVVGDGGEEDEEAELAHMDSNPSWHPSALLPQAPVNPGLFQELAQVQPYHAAHVFNF